MSFALGRKNGEKIIEQVGAADRERVDRSHGMGGERMRDTPWLDAGSGDRAGGGNPRRI
jgi:hypothetical protein